MLSFFNRYFIRGIILILPVTLTVYILYYGSIKAENLFGGLIKSLIGPQFYVSGMGIIVGLMAIFLVGLLTSNFITRRLVNFFTSRFARLPLVRAIYNPLKDLMSLFSSSSNSEMANKKVVIVTLDKIGVRCIGLVTRDHFKEFREGVFGDEDIVVYVPMSYMIGGFSTVVKRSQVTPIDLPVDQALRMAITGWVKAEEEL